MGVKDQEQEQRPTEPSLTVSKNLSTFDVVLPFSHLGIYTGLVPVLQALDRTPEVRSFAIALNNYLMSSTNMENLSEYCEIALKSYSEETRGATMTLYEVAQREAKIAERKKVLQNIPGSSPSGFSSTNIKLHRIISRKRSEWLYNN